MSILLDQFDRYSCLFWFILFSKLYVYNVLTNSNTQTQILLHFPQLLGFLQISN